MSLWSYIACDKEYDYDTLTSAWWIHMILSVQCLCDHTDVWLSACADSFCREIVTLVCNLSLNLLVLDTFHWYLKTSPMWHLQHGSLYQVSNVEFNFFEALNVRWRAECHNLSELSLNSCSLTFVELHHIASTLILNTRQSCARGTKGLLSSAKLTQTAFHHLIMWHLLSTHRRGWKMK